VERGALVLVVSKYTKGELCVKENGKGLTPELCLERAAYCRELIPTTELERVKTMLEHIALTWERIAARLTEGD
jgi:hypothetical protein